MNFFKRHILWGVYETFSYREVYKGIKDLWKNNLIKGNEVKQFEEEFARFLGVKYAYSFGAGRMALYSILKAMHLKEGSEVIVTGYTCVVVPAAVLYAGLKPVYVDIEDYNLNIKELENKITKKTKVIIAQHTYGIPLAMEKITKIAKKHKLKVIEDCAHVIGGKYHGRMLGTFGDAAFFSFENSKVISTIEGGMAVTNSKRLEKELKKYYEKTPFPSKNYVKKCLFNLTRAVLNDPKNYCLRRIFDPLGYRTHLFITSTTEEDCQGIKLQDYPRRLPNALARVGRRQLRRLNAMNAHRRKIALYYNVHLKNLEKRQLQETYLLRYPLKVKKKEKLKRSLLQKGIEVGEWFEAPLHPKETKHEAFNYLFGECPKSETLTKEIINLPIGPKVTLKDAEKIIRYIKVYQRI